MRKSISVAILFVWFFVQTVFPVASAGSPIARSDAANDEFPGG